MEEKKQKAISLFKYGSFISGGALILFGFLSYLWDKTIIMCAFMILIGFEFILSGYLASSLFTKPKKNDEEEDL